MLLQLVLEGTPEEIVANYIVSIPQAVGVVATICLEKNLTHILWVSIPQAVGVVATWLSEKQKLDASVGFQYRER